ncbi:aldo/keto reductase [Acrocarpospora corrugata]|uniref:aldo/keto reductase n=1 Tax=Acrocarpospora corrugata TaxID=35763 RepID=UPI001C3F78E4|nr:aldo/keto reductase [Acrocarpospora corrugata]
MTALDTAYNYQHFGSHRALAATAADLLPDFSISTKVGYFPGGHDLDPTRLRHAVRQSAQDLGRTPDTVLLHNPERSPGGLVDGCAALEQARQEGLCRAWGISTWDPQPLLGPLLDGTGAIPRPDVVMVRAGLTVPAAVLEAGERFAEHVRARRVWGMAPFGGDTSDPVWAKIDTSLFLAPGQQATAIQAVTAAAFAIPEVACLAVGTSNLDHLNEVSQASRLEADIATVRRYRDLLSRRATVGR